MPLTLKDSDGVRVRAGCKISFSYGIPPVRVVAPVVRRGNKLVAIAETDAGVLRPVRVMNL